MKPLSSILPVKIRMLFSVLLLPILLSGCGSDTTPKKEDVTKNTPPKPVPVREKIVGGWTAAIKFDNDDYSQAREKLGDEAAVDQLDKIVEDLMGTTFQIVFRDDGTLEASKPGGSLKQRAPGTYTVENDNNSTADLKLEINSPGGTQSLTRQAKFDGDDEFQAPWDIQVPEQAKSIFFAEFRRDKFAD